MSKGKLVKHSPTGRFGIIIEGPVKEPLVGHIYRVMFFEGPDWVYPEHIDVMQEKRCLLQKRKETLK